jgi:hypothetical protein
MQTFQKCFNIKIPIQQTGRRECGKGNGKIE